MDDKKKYLILTLNNNYYCLPLSLMREVIVAGEITSLPNSDSSYVGVINLRGEIISVIDLGEKIGIGPTRIVPTQTCIIIAQKKDITIGILVDAVVAGKSYTPEEILLPQTNIPEKAGTQNFVAAFTQDKELGELLLLLDFEKIIASSHSKKEG